MTYKCTIFKIFLIVFFMGSPARCLSEQAPAESKGQKLVNLVRRNKERIIAFSVPATLVFGYLGFRSSKAVHQNVQQFKLNFEQAGLLKKLVYTHFPVVFNIIGLPIPSLVDRTFLISSLNSQDLKKYIKIEAGVIACIVGGISVICYEAYKRVHLQRQLAENKELLDQFLAFKESQAQKGQVLNDLTETDDTP